MTAEHHILARIEATLSGYRDTIARLTPELAHLREEKVIIMKFLSEFGGALTSLIAARQASDERAEAAEAKNADLEKQIAADEATLKAMLDETTSELAAEKPTVTTAPSGATVTVDPAAGATTHVAEDVTTTVPHDGSAPTAVDASVTPAQPVEPAREAVAEAVAATEAAGVTVPSTN